MDEAEWLRPFRVHAPGIGAEPHPLLLELELHVVLAHGEVHREDVVSFGFEEVEDGLVPVHAEIGRDLRQSPSLVFLEVRVRELREDDALRRGLLAEVLPEAGRVAHLLEDLRPGLGIAQVLVQLAVGRRPRRDTGGEPGPGAGVGIHIGGDVDAAGPCLVDLRDCRLHLRPVLPAGGFQVVDLGDHAGRPGDLQLLVDGLEELVTLRAEVRDMHAVVGGNHLHDLDQLGRGRIGVRRVDQGRGDAEGTVLHRLGDDPAHLRDGFRRRVTHGFAHTVLADRAAAEE